MKQISISETHNSLIPFSGTNGVIATMRKIYGRNLIRNGGYDGEACTAFVDTDGDGLADGFSKSSVGTASIENNAQKLVHTDDTETYLKIDAQIEEGKRYKLSFQYQNSGGSRNVVEWGAWLSVATLSEALTYKLFELEFTADDNATNIYFNKTSQSGDYFLIKDIELREVQIVDESGNNNDLQIYGSPSENYLGSLKSLNTESSVTSLREGKEIDLFTTEAHIIIGYRLTNNNNLDYIFLGLNENIYSNWISYYGGNIRLRQDDGVILNVSSPSLLGKVGVISIYANGQGNITITDSNGASGTVTLTDSLSFDMFIDGYSSGNRLIGEVIFLLRSSIYSDTQIKQISDRLLYLAKTIGVWKGTSQKSIGNTINIVGVSSIESTDAYGIWEFEVNSNVFNVGFISDRQDTVLWEDFLGYRIVCSNEKIYVQKHGIGTVANLFVTVDNYLADSSYSFRITRNSYTDEFITGAKGTFAVYIKGGSFGTKDWTLVQSNGETADANGYYPNNPKLDDTYKISNYFVTNLISGTVIKNIKIPYKAKSNNLIPPIQDFVISGANSFINYDENYIHLQETDPNENEDYVTVPFTVKAGSKYKIKYYVLESTLNDNVFIQIGDVNSDISKELGENAKEIVVTTWTNNYIKFATRAANNNGTYIKFIIREITEINEKYSDLEDANFIGTLHTEDGSYPTDADKVDDIDDYRYSKTANGNTLIYAPLPITLKDDMINDLSANNRKVVGVTDNRQVELSLESLMFNQQKIQSGGIAVSLSGSNLAVASSGDVITMNLVNPSTGRVLGYTRTKDGSNYNHKFYVDYEMVDSFTNSNEFDNSSSCDIPLDVSGSQLTITPSDYILDDLIVDSKVYIENQFRAFWLADKLVDDSNHKIKIAPVSGFSNSIIYSVEDVEEDNDLYELAQANREIKVIKKYV